MELTIQLKQRTPTLAFQLVTGFNFFKTPCGWKYNKRICTNTAPHCRGRVFLHEAINFFKSKYWFVWCEADRISQCNYPHFCTFACLHIISNFFKSPCLNMDRKFIKKKKYRIVTEQYAYLDYGIACMIKKWTSLLRFARNDESSLSNFYPQPCIWKCIILLPQIPLAGL